MRRPSLLASHSTKHRSRLNCIPWSRHILTTHQGQPPTPHSTLPHSSPLPTSAPRSKPRSPQTTETINGFVTLSTMLEASNLSLRTEHLNRDNRNTKAGFHIHLTSHIPPKHPPSHHPNSLLHPNPHSPPPSLPISLSPPLSLSSFPTIALSPLSLFFSLCSQFSL